MKRTLSFFSITLILLLSMSRISFAQDDAYYDPNNDPAKQSTVHQNDNNSSQQEPVDKTDGYGSPSIKYDSPSKSETHQENGNTYITNNYYDDEDYTYTSHLHRYYYPSYGAGYYSYCFTPSFYFGFNFWNPYASVALNPWYTNPWWRWNYPYYSYYDPFYGPYWAWNSPYYYGPYGAYGYGYPYGGYHGHGYNGADGYGHGHGYGYSHGCGGYYNPYGGGGYNYGYQNGYNSSYWNSTAYNNNYYYSSGQQGSGGEQPTTYTPPVSNPTFPNAKNKDLIIPKEGIQTPITPSPSNDVRKLNTGVNIQSNTIQPYKPGSPNVVGTTAPKSTEEKTSTDIPSNYSDRTTRSEDPRVIQNNNPRGEIYSQPNAERSETPQWAQPDPWTNDNGLTGAPQSRYNRSGYERNMQNQAAPGYSAPDNSPQVQPQQRSTPQNAQRNQPQRMEPQQMEQQRLQPSHSTEPRQMQAPRNYSVQPQQERQSQGNIHQSAPVQRNFTPSNSGGGGSSYGAGRIGIR